MFSAQEILKSSQPHENISTQPPTLADAVDGVTKLLEGQNVVLDQLVQNVIRDHPQDLSQPSLIANLSRSISSSMVEHARLLDLLVRHTMLNQRTSGSDQNNSDSILPSSQLPMDLEEHKIQNRRYQRELPKVDVSDWEITCTEIRPHDANCFNCGQPSHFIRECPLLQRKRQAPNKRNKGKKKKKHVQHKDSPKLCTMKTSRQDGVINLSGTFQLPRYF